MLLPLHIFQELDVVVRYLYFACTHLRVAVFFPPGICIQKSGLFPHKNYSTSDAFSNQLLFCSSFPVEPELPACCDRNTPIIKDMQPFSQAAFFTGTYRMRDNTKMDSDPFRNPHILCFSEISQLSVHNELRPTDFFQENLLAKPKPKDSEKESMFSVHYSFCSFKKKQ